MLKRLIVVASTVLVVALGASGCTPPDGEDGPEQVVGLADFHSHQFGGLGFGGHVVSHSHDPTTACLPILPYAGDGNQVKDIVRKQLFQEATAQAARSECYPTTSSFTGQRVDTTNLERAWRYGLRLLVVLGLSNEFLCRVGNLSDDPAGVCPTDQAAIEEQLQAAKDLEAKIDADSGGPGSGWYRIVRTPEEARQAIGQGKLAVVLGTEAVNAFGCKVVARDVVPGVPNLGGEKPDEQAYQNSCPAIGGHPEYPKQRALALFERYWQLGARHFFPIHNMDGVAGGTAVSIPLLHSDHNPTRLARADLLDRAGEVDRVIIAIRPPFETVECRQFEFDRPSGTPGRCNGRGLSDTGRALIRMMASYGAVIDADHMSLKTKNEVLGSEGLLGGVYPIVSSHTGAVAIANGDKSNEGQVTEEQFAAQIKAGGAFGPILPPATGKTELDTYPAAATVAPHTCGGTTESFVQVYRYVVDKLRGGTLVNGTPAYVGVGFGTDFTAPGTGGPQPRFERTPTPVTGGLTWLFGPSLVSGGLCYTPSAAGAPAQLSYPFVSTSPISAGTEFDRSNVPWPGERSEPYDIGLDGVAHIGMIPDFVEELRAMGLTADEVDPLWHGAEAYIRMWEASTAWAGNFNEEDNKGIAEECARLRNELLTVIGPDSARAPILDSLEQTGCHGA